MRGLSSGNVQRKAVKEDFCLLSGLDRTVSAATHDGIRPVSLEEV
jgi:hypothetical protein